MSRLFRQRGAKTCECPVRTSSERLGRHLGFLLSLLCPRRCYIAVWYTSSLGCLLLNKTILSELGGTSAQLGLCQMVATALFGGIRVWSMSGFTGFQSTPPVSRPTQSNRGLHGTRPASLSWDSEGRSSAFAAPATKSNGKVISRDSAARRRHLWVTIIVLATFRTTSVLLGLVSLKHVPASFTETIKSTAPLFTVYLQHLLLGMRTSPQVSLSLSLGVSLPLR